MKADKKELKTHEPPKEDIKCFLTSDSGVFLGGAVMIAKLVRKNGFMQISINGKNFPPTACMTYNPNIRTFQSFQEVNTPFASVGAYAPDRGINDFSGMGAFGPGFWIGEDMYDFSEVDRVFSLLAPKGNEVYIFPRVYLDCPIWWAKKHPEELSTDERGNPQREAYASEVWRNDAVKALKALMDHINQSVWRDCVVGYHIACGSTEEWTNHHYTDEQYRVDFSEPNRRAFIRWLTNKYENTDALNKAWNTDFSCFDEVTFPTLLERCYSTNGALRDVDKEMKAIDFWTFTSFLFADTISFLCRAVKEYSDNNLLTGAFYGYIGYMSAQEKGHFALENLLRCPYIDFIASTVFAAPANSLDLHNKLFFQEGDVRTCLTRPIRDTLPQCDPGNGYFDKPAWRPLPDMKTTMSKLKSVAARVLTGTMGIWWFDMWGGWFDAPEIMELFGRFNKWMADRENLPLRSEIAVITDENGLMYQPRFNNHAKMTLSDQRDMFEALGAPYDFYEASDLLEESFPFDQYRMVILLDFIHPSEALKEVIKKRLRKNGRTLVWSHLTETGISGFETEYNRFDEPRRGNFEGTLFPKELIGCPRFTAEATDGAYTYACFEGSAEPCVLARQNSDCCDVLSLLPAIPENLLRQIARMAGVHLYTFGGDVIYAGGNFVAIRALTDGHKRIMLPFPVKSLTDAESGVNMPLYNNIYTDFVMKESEVRIFRVDV